MRPPVLSATPESLKRLPQGLLRAAMQGLAAMCCALTIGCASRLPTSSNGELLQDALYPLAAQPAIPDRESVFRLSSAMLRYADERIGPPSARRDARRNLLEALYRDGELRLDYDASVTRNAAEAFEARAGNCLSLVIMTAAFAQHLGLPVTFQNVQTEDFYTRQGDLVLISGHVNLRLGQGTRQAHNAWTTDDDWVVDFVPGAKLGQQRTQVLDENTVVAMYYNNRAAETLATGGREAAYSWARAALLAAPDYLPAVNTLAVIYMRDGHLAAAERALRRMLQRQPDSISGLNNLALLLQRSHREAEAREVLARLARLQPESPFQLYDQGRLAMEQGQYAQARELFARELRRQPGQSDVHFWSALAALQLGDLGAAARQLQLAVETSTSPAARERYTGKLARLHELQGH